MPRRIGDLAISDDLLSMNGQRIHMRRPAHAIRLRSPLRASAVQERLRPPPEQSNWRRSSLGPNAGGRVERAPLHRQRGIAVCISPRVQASKWTPTTATQTAAPSRREALPDASLRHLRRRPQPARWAPLRRCGWPTMRRAPVAGRAICALTSISESGTSAGSPALRSQRK
jgi:hypothetical protein